MKTKVHLSRLGIISGDSKRLLEAYVDTRAFSQRKCYDEWVVDWCAIDLDLDLRDLFILSERFDIRVGNGWVELEEVL